jgi:hypothetical protein
MALNRPNPPTSGTADGLGVGPDDATEISSDVSANVPAVLPGGGNAVMAPIVVANTLWQSTNPAAYDGGRPTDITHLGALGLTDEVRRNDARWGVGVLEVIPTKADFVLDLLRANSLWPLLSGLACCAIEMMSAATSKNDMDRWGMFPFRA